MVFVARLPPLGYSTFYLQPLTGSGRECGSGGKQSTAPAGSSKPPRLHGMPLPSKAAVSPHAGSSRGSSGSGGDDRYVMLDNGIVSVEFDTKTGVRAAWQKEQGSPWHECLHAAVGCCQTTPALGNPTCCT